MYKRKIYLKFFLFFTAFLCACVLVNLCILNEDKKVCYSLVLNKKPCNVMYLMHFC